MPFGTRWIRRGKARKRGQTDGGGLSGVSLLSLETPTDARVLQRDRTVRGGLAARVDQTKDDPRRRSR
jgi:hypothetical protein